MPLLSTLAALVIIVHSAEEHRDRDRDYRYDLRPRSLDTVTPNYDQVTVLLLARYKTIHSQLCGSGLKWTTRNLTVGVVRID